jgi:hypothetical protein
MGWLYGWQKRSDLIYARTKDFENDKVTVKCLAKCYRGSSWSGSLWVVWERIEKDGSKPPVRQITCDLLRFHKPDGWGYKDLSEYSGPPLTCPMKYLSMVPDDSPHVNAEWRAQLRAKDAAKIKVVKKGMVFKGSPTARFRGQPIDEIVIMSVRPLYGLVNGVGPVNLKRSHLAVL